MVVVACLAFGTAALAQPGSVVGNPTGSPESTTPLETVPVLPPAKPTLAFPERNTVQARYVKDFVPVRGSGEDDNEYNTYNSLVLHTRNFTVEEMLAVARKDVSYGDLLAKDDEHRESYRFDIIRFDGHLKRLKKIPSNPELAAAGIPELYEAWIYPAKDNKPICVLLIEPPAGVEPNLDIVPGRTVTVAGYFFKTIAFTSGEKASKEGNTVTRFAPLIFAKGMIAQPLSDSDAGNIWRTAFLPAVLTVIGVLTLFVLGLTWYFRRGDRVSKRAVDANKLNPFEAPLQIPPGEPGEFDNFSQDRP
jgi:hypothetical protein